MTNDNRKDTPDEDDIARQVCSMLGLPQGIPMDVTLNMGPLAPSRAPFSVSWREDGQVNEFKVFVKYENEDGGLARLIGEDEAQALLERGPLMVCTVIGFPAEVIPDQDIIHAAHFAEAADPGEVAQFVPEEHQHRTLCLGGPIAFQVGRYRCPAFWKRNEIVKLPLVIGISYPTGRREGK